VPMFVMCQMIFMRRSKTKFKTRFTSTISTPSSFTSWGLITKT